MIFKRCILIDYDAPSQQQHKKYLVVQNYISSQIRAARSQSRMFQ